MADGKNLDYYDGLPWRVIIDPERQEDGQIIFVASHPEFDGVLVLCHVEIIG